jgi:hypothetical protein
MWIIVEADQNSLGFLVPTIMDLIFQIHVLLHFLNNSEDSYPLLSCLCKWRLISKEWKAKVETNMI